MIRIRSFLFVSSSLLSRLNFDRISLGNFSEAIILEVISYFFLLIFSALSQVSARSSVINQLHVHLRLDYRFRLMFRVFHSVGETKVLKDVRSVNPK